MRNPASFFSRVIALALLSVVFSCSAREAHGNGADTGDKKTNDSTKQEKLAASPDVSALASSGCNESLWSNVYDPTRLHRVKDCITATGTIDESNVDDDGDQHLLLRLDPGQQGLLKKKNMTKKNGDLVIEIVCANKVMLKKAKAACKGYSNRIQSPVLGAHVKVTGTYVIDTHNGWTEIHPVSQIEVVK